MATQSTEKISFIYSLIALLSLNLMMDNPKLTVSKMQLKIFIHFLN